MSEGKGSSKTDTLVKVVLVFFISLLSFSVGTFVGKQVSDSDHRRMALEGEYKGDRSVASTKEEGAEGSEKISEKEVENLTEEFVNKEKPATGAEQAAVADEESATAATAEKGGEKIEKSAEKDSNGYKTVKREKVATTKKATAKVAEAAADKPEKMEKVEKVEKTAEAKTGESEDRKPSSTLPSVASSAVGKYTVQVGSFADEKEAKGHAAELKGKGWNAFYFAASVQGRTWYRVSVGLFNNMTSANKFRAEFMKDSGTKAAIVQKVIQ